MKWFDYAVLTLLSCWVYYLHCRLDLLHRTHSHHWEQTQAQSRRISLVVSKVLHLFRVLDIEFPKDEDQK